MKRFNSFKNLRKIGLFIFVCFLPKMAMAELPVCEDIFTEPPTGNHGDIIPFPTTGAITQFCDSRTENSKCEGIYSGTENYFTIGIFGHTPQKVNALNTNTKTTYIYFSGDVNLNRATLNANHGAENLFLYVSGNLTLENNSKINGIVYVRGKVTISKNSEIEGALASASFIDDDTKQRVDFEDDELEDADLSEICIRNPIPPKPNQLLLKYGSGGFADPEFTKPGSAYVEHWVRFHQPFPDGVTPFVFLMPIIDKTSPENDGPASLYLTKINNRGFNWIQRNAPTKLGFAQKPSKPMLRFDYIAINSGNHQLSDKTKLKAGYVEIDEAMYSRNSDQYKKASGDPKLSVVLTQIQPDRIENDKSDPNKKCWLTSVSKRDSRNEQLFLGLDASEAHIGPFCIPRLTPLDELEPERHVAYLALEPKKGVAIINGREVRYEFGKGSNTNKPSSQPASLSEQCQFQSPFTKGWFKSTPLLVAGKNSRNGRDGGWLRRCNISKDSVGMVVDEDIYHEPERNHQKEEYSFVALEKVNTNPPDNCFVDDFNRSNLGNNWAAKVIDKSEVPHIIDDSRMRLTSTLTEKQSASITLQKLFPTKNNHIVIEFDYYAWRQLNQNEQAYKGGDGLSFVFSDSRITPQPGAIGGALGYTPLITDTRDHMSAVNLPGFAGGWLGIGFDTTGNYSNPNDGEKNGGIGYTPQSIAVRGAQGNDRYHGYPYLKGTDTLFPKLDALVPLAPPPSEMPPQRGDRYRITYDSKTQGEHYLKIERKFKGQPQYQATPILLLNDTELKQQQLPENIYLSLTAATGADRNNHEIDNFNVCSDVITPVGNQVHHFEFSYGSPLTCSAETIRIKACKTADCQEPNGIFKEPLTATLSVPNDKGAFWVRGNQVNFNNGYANVDLRSLTLDSLTLAVESSKPSTRPGSDTLCSGTIEGQSELNSKNCTLSFAKSGLLIHIPNQYANKSVQGTVSAVRSSNNALECVPEFAGVDKNIRFWTQYSTPVFGSPSVVITANKTTKKQPKLTEIGKNEDSATPVLLHFNEKGIAQFQLNYPDAGLITLHGRYHGSLEHNDNKLEMLGSASFVRSPVGFCVQPEKTCALSDVSCPVFKKAGELFNLSITPMAWEKDLDADFCKENTSTPSYTQSSLAITSKIIAPNHGADGQLAVKNYDHKGALESNETNVLANGTNLIKQSISEVGVFKFYVKAPEYLGSKLNVIKSVSQNTGRFVPAWYFVEGSISPACTSGKFSYMSEPFDLTSNITALNVQGHKTQNYTGNFAKGYAYLSAEPAVNQNLSNRFVDYHNNQPTLPIIWLNGQGTTTHTVNFKRAEEQQLDGPFNETKLGINIIDAETPTVAKVQSQDLNTTSSFCTIPYSCNAKALGTQAIRFGRITMDNVYGPETQTLIMPTYAQYWAGNNKGWQINDLDSCTQVTKTCSSGDCTKQVISQLDSTEKYEPSLVQPQQVIRKGTGAFKQGKFELMWQNIGTEKYRGKITAPLEVPNWLKFYWQWDDKNNNDENPRASAYFGTYRGNDKIIYWREIN